VRQHFNFIQYYVPKFEFHFCKKKKKSTLQHATTMYTFKLCNLKIKIVISRLQFSSYKLYNLKVNYILDCVIYDTNLNTTLSFQLYNPKYYFQVINYII